MLENLKSQVLKANLDLVEHKLVLLTWGNASAIDRDKELLVIKPSGIAYSAMTEEDMVVVDLNGKRIEGSWEPSSDTPTHLALYKSFPHIGGIAHTHSTYAAIFCQAAMDLPCLGTTHADHFNGTVPLPRHLGRPLPDPGRPGAELV